MGRLVGGSQLFLATLLAQAVLVLWAGCGGPSEDGAKCATDSDCVNQCIDAVCATPRAIGEMCAHGGQCGKDAACASWRQVGRCSKLCDTRDDCTGTECQRGVTVAGKGVWVCKPDTVIDVGSCSDTCERICTDESAACFHCKQACRCRCSGDDECAERHSDDACAQGRCSC